MDGTSIVRKLVGRDQERAVSPVIGVILMVAITVVLAAVIAAFVLDMGDSMGQGSVDAAVSTNVSQIDSTVSFSLIDDGGAEKFVLRGDVHSFDSSDGDDPPVAGSEDVDLIIDEALQKEIELDFTDGTTGVTDILEHDPDDSTDRISGQDENVLARSGEVNIVAVDGNSESIIGSVDWDFE